MNIRIKKDIPGYKAGEVYETSESELFYSKSALTPLPRLTLNTMIRDGWAEEVKEHICVVDDAIACTGERFPVLGYATICEYRKQIKDSCTSYSKPETPKDEIDMEEIRRKHDFEITFNKFTGKYYGMHPETKLPTDDELKFFTAYRIVKYVIDTLNGEWEGDITEVGVVEISYNTDCPFPYRKGFNVHSTTRGVRQCIIPVIKNTETAEKVISLCEPELRVLFSVK